MVYLIALLAGLAVTLTVVAVAGVVPERSRAVSRELARLEDRRKRQPGTAAAAERADPHRRAVAMLRRLGTAVRGGGGTSDRDRRLLMQAGFRGADAATVYLGTRLGLGGALACAAVLPASLLGTGGAVPLLAAAWGGALGWCLPPILLRRRVSRRRQEVLQNLPDALDLLVICVEAGLGLNQALARMAEEMRHFSPVTAAEFAQVNLEIRAGGSREQALRGLGARTDLPELRSLASMLVQTDRFGTSIAQALRLHSAGLRTRWQQRMEETAAKTTVKLIFPLVLCILPVLFVIILGPAVIRMLRSLGGM